MGYLALLIPGELIGFPMKSSRDTEQGPNKLTIVMASTPCGARMKAPPGFCGASLVSSQTRP